MDRKKQDPVKAPTTTAPLLTRQEAAKFLHISVDGLDKLIHENEDFPLLKAGRRSLFQREELIKWARSQAEARKRRRRK